MVIFDIKTSFVLVIGFLNFILGGFVFLRNRAELVNKSFGSMTLLVGLWSISAFFFRTAGFDNTLTWGYILYAVAATLPSIFLIMTLTFPPRSLLNKRVFLLLFFETVFIIWITLIRNFVITGVHYEGSEKILTWGRYYFIYVLHQVLFFSLGYSILFKKYFEANGIQKQQVKYIGLGTILPANLALLTNLLLPWFGIYTYYTWMGQIFMIFIVIFSGYSILRHHLFDIKVIAEEIFVLATSTTLLIRFFLAKNTSDRWVEASVFIVVTVFGILLIKSAWKEVEQKEQLERLDKQLENANEQLKQLDKARAEFISIASHQLRTPPATIKWYLAAVLGGDFGEINDRARKAIQTAEMTNNSQISLIDDMLNASRIERGKMEFLFEPTDLLKITQITVDQLMPQAIQRKQKLTFATPKIQLPQINADKEKLRQVINNLIDNAIKYSPSGGSITVVLEKTAKDVFVKVTDTGRGIKTEELGKIFTKYDRGGRKMDSQGLGLGLYVAKVIVEQHKGKIWAESAGENKGSTFIMQLPIKTDIKNSTFDLAKK